jgi:predicted anti-sigma-YlaC factor YlaD
MSTDEMTCKELVELVTEYLEGTLSTLDCTRFDEHLAECPACRTYLQQMRQTIRVVGRLPEESLSTDSREELLRAFRTWTRG